MFSRKFPKNHSQQEKRREEKRREEKRRQYLKDPVRKIIYGIRLQSYLFGLACFSCSQ